MTSGPWNLADIVLPIHTWMSEHAMIAGLHQTVAWLVDTPQGIVAQSSPQAMLGVMIMSPICCVLVQGMMIYETDSSLSATQRLKLP